MTVLDIFATVVWQLRRLARVRRILQGCNQIRYKNSCSLVKLLKWTIESGVFDLSCWAIKLNWRAGKRIVLVSMSPQTQRGNKIWTATTKNCVFLGWFKYNDDNNVEFSFQFLSTHSIYTKWRDLEIMYHVSTLLVSAIALFSLYVKFLKNMTVAKFYFPAISTRRRPEGRAQATHWQWHRRHSIQRHRWRICNLSVRLMLFISINCLIYCCFAILIFAGKPIVPSTLKSEFNHVWCA